MLKNLENYLEEIGHFLPDPAEREEILNEIRSHIMEKAEQEGGPVTEAALDKIIAAYGRPRRVADKYLEGKPIIAPVYRRYLFRYTGLLFAIHLAFAVSSVIFQESFTVFPFLFIPRLGIIDAVMYLPMAFLADFGFVALLLYFITRSGREIRLPWPRFALNLDEVKAPAAKTLAARIGTLAGATIMLALTVGAAVLYLKFQTVFLVRLHLKEFRPLLMPEPGRLLSLAVLIMLAAGTIGRFVKLFTLSRRAACWVDAAADAVALVMIGMVLGQPHAGLLALDIPAKLQDWSQNSLIITLFIVSLIVAVDLVINLVRLGRKRAAEPGPKA